MSHGDKIIKLPKNFKVIAKTDNCPAAAIQHESKKIFGVQFHPEVVHTKEGKNILLAFLRDICKAHQNWTMASFIEYSTELIKKQVGNKHVVLGLSGGVDSSV